jgi:Flp pilus assembly protein TadG
LAGNSTVDRLVGQGDHARAIEHPPKVQAKNDMRRYLKGQTYVEFAFIAVVILSTIFAVINFSLAIYAYNFVSYAAREGTRFAAVHGASNPSPAHATDIAKLVITAAYGLNSQNLNVTTTWSPDNKPGSMVLVRVRYTFNFTIPFITLKPVNLISTSQMMISY